MAPPLPRLTSCTGRSPCAARSRAGTRCSGTRSRRTKRTHPGRCRACTLHPRHPAGARSTRGARAPASARQVLAATDQDRPLHPEGMAARSPLLPLLTMPVMQPVHVPLPFSHCRQLSVGLKAGWGRQQQRAAGSASWTAAAARGHTPPPQVACHMPCLPPCRGAAPLPVLPH